MDLSIQAVLEAETEIKDDRGVIFKPTKEECNYGLIHVCYSCAKDRYIRVSSNNEETPSWLASTYSCTNIFRKVEYDWNMTYLARDDVRSPPGGQLSWKFDVNGTNQRMDKLELRAQCKLYEDGRVIWTICTDKRNFVQTTKSLQDYAVFELEGATTLTITAFLTGGTGECLYQHAQLFRQETRDKHNDPFQVKLFLKPDTDTSVAGPGREMNEMNNGYIFRPNEEELVSKSMSISYNSSKDYYTRRSVNYRTTQLPNWADYTYSNSNIIRKTDNRIGEYLTLRNGANFGKVSWKFDVSEFGLKLKLMKLRAPSSLESTASVLWVICSGKQCYMERGDALDRFMMIFELEGATELTITAFLSGMGGSNSQLQLFRGPLEIELQLEEGPQPVVEAFKLNSETTYAADLPGDGACFTFKPTEEETEKRMMHICYSCTNDTYLRKSSHDEVLYGWQQYTYSCANLFRKEDSYKWLTYVVRQNDDKKGEVSWKFDVADTGLVIHEVKIQASAAAVETGVVLWRISSGNQVHTKTLTADSLPTTSSVFKAPNEQTPSTFKFFNARDLTITTCLQGGQGAQSWEHSQLFPQPLDDVQSFPFEVKVFLGLPRAGGAVGGDIDATGWRHPQRQTFGIPAEICAQVDKSFVFRPTEEELSRRLMHIGYCCATDYYVRHASPGEKMVAWLDHTFSATNMYRKEECDHDMVYLARIEGTQFAEVTWKFDVNGTGFNMNKLELKARTALYEDASVLWTVRAGDQAFIRTAECFRSMTSMQTFDLDRATTVSITAFLTGGEGLVAWQHSQLFRQEMDTECIFPFDIKLFLDPSNKAQQLPSVEQVSYQLPTDNFALPAEICEQVDEHFVFKPTEREVQRKLMHIRYNTSEDDYVRDEKGMNASWQRCTYSCTNVFRKEEYDHQMTYLGRMEGTQFAEVTWKFDVAETDLCMAFLELKAFTERFDDGCIIWTIQADEKKFIKSAESLEDSVAFELDGSTTLSITAFMAGGRGPVAWQHSQLFRQPLRDDNEFPFEIKLFLEPENNYAPSSPGSAKKRRRDLSDDDLSVQYTFYTFKPKEEELADQLIHINYDTFNDVYLRPSERGLHENHTWKDYVYSSINIMRVDDREEQVAYLARTNGSESARVTWKFDVTGTDYAMASVDLKARGHTFDSDSSASIMWRISTDDNRECFNETGDELSTFKTFELHGSQILTITAFLKGGVGVDEWKETQIFRRDAAPYSYDYPFEVKVKLQPIDEVAQARCANQ